MQTSSSVTAGTNITPHEHLPKDNRKNKLGTVPYSHYPPSFPAVAIALCLCSMADNMGIGGEVLVTSATNKTKQTVYTVSAFRSLVCMGDAERIMVCRTCSMVATDGEIPVFRCVTATLYMGS